MAHEPERANEYDGVDEPRALPPKPRRPASGEWSVGEEATDFLGLGDMFEDSAAEGAAPDEALPAENSQTSWLLAGADPLAPGAGWETETPLAAPPPRHELPLPSSVESAATGDFWSDAPAPAAPEQAPRPGDPGWLLGLDDSDSGRAGSHPVVPGSHFDEPAGLPMPLDASYVEPEPRSAALSRAAYRGIAAAAALAGLVTVWTLLERGEELDSGGADPVRVDSTAVAEPAAPAERPPLGPSSSGPDPVSPDQRTNLGRTSSTTPDYGKDGTRWYSNVAGGRELAEPSELDPDPRVPRAFTPGAAEAQAVLHSLAAADLAPESARGVLAELDALAETPPLASRGVPAGGAVSSPMDLWQSWHLRGTDPAGMLRVAPRIVARAPLVSWIELPFVAATLEAREPAAEPSRLAEPSSDVPPSAELQVLEDLVQLAEGNDQSVGLRRERLADHWYQSSIPIHALDGDRRLLTPYVGNVRVIYSNDEVFEGRLFALGQRTVWVETPIGRMSLEGERVTSLERIDTEVSHSPARSAPTTVAGLPRIQVRAAGGVFIGHQIAREGEEVTLLTDEGYRIQLESADVGPASGRRRTVGITGRGRKDRE